VILRTSAAATSNNNTLRWRGTRQNTHFSACLIDIIEKDLCSMFATLLMAERKLGTATRGEDGAGRLDRAAGEC
jgi:hypothetical protein